MFNLLKKFKLASLIFALRFCPATVLPTSGISSYFLEKFIFIHIPKTAGTSLKIVLKKQWRTKLYNKK
jgi:hypothetical protein